MDRNMKKFTASMLATAAIVASLPASAATIPSTTSVTSTNTSYLSTTTFNTSNHDLNNIGTASWDFLFNPSFSLPGSSITEAWLIVSARQADDANDFINVNNTQLGALLPGTGNSEELTTFSLLPLFNTSGTWSASNTLSLALQLNYNAPSQSNKALTLEYATISLKFADVSNGNNNTDQNAPAAGAVPEPGTAALFGLGLAGALLAQRRQRRQG
jgi:hypothetical protein